MKRFKSTVCAVLALTFAAGSGLPAAAAPVLAPKASQSESANSNVIDVQLRRDERQRNRFERRQERRENRFDRRQDRREARFEQRNGRYYYNGHRGYRHKRPGYRYHNGFWFPAGAFIAGAIISGAINGSSSARSNGSAHVQWCYDRYRSYRASDNTFQPYNGPRQQCYSPYS
jgi:hypothetical protein